MEDDNPFLQTERKKKPWAKKNTGQTENDQISNSSQVLVSETSTGEKKLRYGRLSHSSRKKAMIKGDNLRRGDAKAGLERARGNLGLEVSGKGEGGVFPYHEGEELVWGGGPRANQNQ